MVAKLDELQKHKNKIVFKLKEFAKNRESETHKFSVFCEKYNLDAIREKANLKKYDKDYAPIPKIDKSLFKIDISNNTTNDLFFLIDLVISDFEGRLLTKNTLTELNRLGFTGFNKTEIEVVIHKQIEIKLHYFFVQFLILLIIV